MIRSFRGRLMSENELRWNMKRLEDLFARHDAYPRFFVPVINVAGVTVPVNGDEFPKIVHDVFDHIWVATLKGREVAKQKQFTGYPKVKIKTFPVKLPARFRRKRRKGK